ncbi:MAG: formate/nitrite transporter family protein [Anaerohalosphaeraceae bacterium]|nr:formate/nitrite transporter family protein [Anaerohalosphaeraceae bacterium]
MSDRRQNINADSIDAILPAQMAKKAEDIGVAKANLSNAQLLLLAILAGAFIAFAAQFYTIVMVGAGDTLGFGLSKLVGGLAFSLGLILVIIAGAELFTGNNLKVMALASGKITFKQLLRNWVIVYVGNFVGSVITAVGIYLTEQFTLADNGVGVMAINIANAKCGLEFTPALMSGVYCNVFVCLAVWLCFSARSNTDKVLCIIFPITAFVACGFEHCIANMYFIPIGMLLKTNAAFLGAIGKTSADFANVSTWGFLSNILPVTIGNIIGGAVIVGATYWLIYRKNV